MTVSTYVRQQLASALRSQSAANEICDAIDTGATGSSISVFTRMRLAHALTGRAKAQAFLDGVEDGTLLGGQSLISLAMACISQAAADQLAAGIADYSGVVADPLKFTGTPAASPIAITTYNATGETLHPGVVYFDSPWNGHQWWMAITPYPPSSDENPCIYYSDNGTTWSESGISNPIAPNPGGGGHNADTDLFYNPADDKLYCFWTERFSSVSYKVMVKSSSNGVTWSAASTCLSLNESIAGAASPSVILDGSTYKMWVNDYIALPNVLRLYTCSTPDGTYTLANNCTIFNQPGDIASGREIWHLGIKKIGNYYYGLFNFAAYNTSGSNTTLNFAASKDGITWYTQNEFFHDRGAVAWSNDPYRGVIVQEGSNYWAYYSGYDVSLVSGFARSALTATDFPGAFPVEGDYKTLVDTATFRFRGNGTAREWRSAIGGVWTGTPAYSDFVLDGTQCFDFGGSNSVSTSQNPSVSGSYSMSFWYKKTQATDGSRNSTLFGRGVSGAFTFDHSNSAFRETLIFNSGAWNTSLKLSAVIGEWHHYVGIFNNGDNTVKLYRDGVLVGSQTKGTMSADSAYGIGKVGAGGVAFGQVAECMHFQTALSELDVLTLYNPE